MYYFFFQAEDGIRDGHVTGVQTCALPISVRLLQHALTHPDGGGDETCILADLDARETGVLTDVEYKAYQRSMGAELRNLVRGPLNATFLGRRLVLFGPQGLGRTAMLQDKDFLDE